MQFEQTATADLLNIESEMVRASSGQRFLNYIIDLLLFYALIFLLGITLGLLAPSTIEYLNDDSTSFNLYDRVFTLVFYAVYMGAMEAIFKGKTLGKLITGTRAVDMDGNKISTKTAFSRGFSRAVPFCAFSALGTPCNPWQDRWTNTMVINEKKSGL